MSNLDLIIYAEQKIIGGIIRKNDRFDQISLRPEQFSQESHQILYQNLTRLLNEGKLVELIPFAEVLEGVGALERVGGLSYLSEIVSNASDVSNIESYAIMVSEDYHRREIQALVSSVDDSLKKGKPVEMVKEMLESGCMALMNPESQKTFTHIYDAAVEAIEWEDSDRQGLSTGLRDFDRMTGGLGKSDLIIIAARPSMGKTSLACQIAGHVATNETVAIFSLEMSERQIASRYLRYHESLIGKSQALAHFKSQKLYIDDTPRITVSHIRSKCRTILRQHGLSMIVVDYIQLMEGIGENRTQQIGSISRGLKSIAREFDVPVIALSQLSRKVEERTDKKPVMSDLRESGEIEQDADQIFFIYREEMYDMDSDQKGIAQIICRKNRHGATGEINTTFDGDTTHFGDYSGPGLLKMAKMNYRKFDD